MVTVSGEEVEIPALCAADWLQVLMNPDLHPDDVFPGMLVEADRAYVEDQLHSGELELLDSQQLAMEIISMAGGRPWWVTMRMIAVARVSWDALGGDMSKLDPEIRPLAAWLDHLFILLVRNIDDAKRNMFLMKLEIAPEGWGANPEELEMSTDAFLAMG